MSKTKDKKQSLRLDRTVVGCALTYARQKGWTLGQLILIALKELNKLPRPRWKNCLPKDWQDSRESKPTSVRFPVREEEFINQLKGLKKYNFSEIVEIALWYRVPSLKKRLTEENKELIKLGEKKGRRTLLYRCTSSYCKHDFLEVVDKNGESVKTKCPECGRRALPLSKSRGSYYNWKLKKMLKCLRYQSDKMLDIEDIDGEIVKRFLVRELKKIQRTG
jgi:hypothetical protein